MNGIRKALLEFLVIGVIGVVVGLTANAVSGSGLQLTRDYFGKAPAFEQRSPVDNHDVQNDDANSSTRSQRQAPKPTTDDSHPAHPYKNVNVDEVAEILNDPNTEFGLNVFIDARNDKEYERGHIPGAVQCDHYYLENYLDAVMLAAAAAEKVVVYCNGGDCEDSIFVSTDLIAAGIPFDNIYLFAGGWTDWTAGDHPVATGRDE